MTSAAPAPPLAVECGTGDPRVLESSTGTGDTLARAQVDAVEIDDAVTPPSARDLIAAVTEALTGEPIARAEPAIGTAHDHMRTPRLLLTGGARPQHPKRGHQPQADDARDRIVVGVRTILKFHERPALISAPRRATMTTSRPQCPTAHVGPDAEIRAERDGLLAVLSEARAILDRWDRPYTTAHASNCVHAVGELRALLTPDHPQEVP